MKTTALLALLASTLALAATLSGLPKDVDGFARWKQVASKLPTTGPHAGEGKLVFANGIAAPLWSGNKPLPQGSLIVKTAGKLEQPSLVAIMRKTANGWFYEEYVPQNGGSYRLLAGGPGKQALCADCHARAQNDHLFTRP